MNEKWLTWQNGKLLSLQELHQVTGMTIQRPAMVRRLKQARARGYSVDTLDEQISLLLNRTPAATTDESDIPLNADAEEAKRLKTIREALLFDEKRKQAEIETRLKRREVFYLGAITPVWEAMVIAVREALLGAIPTLVDKILPCKCRDDAVDRAESELIRHLNRISDFDLERTLNESTGEEKWQITGTD